jgi:N-acyl-L-homoserine lactone synthetase
MLDEHFEVVFADTESARSIHYRMRYQVYCLERGYEDPEAYPQGEEYDEWDGNAAHFMVRHRPTGEWLATLRVVMPQGGRLPVIDHCQLPRPVSSGAPLERAAEISRLCIWPAGRRMVAAVPSLSSELLTALLGAALDFSREHGLRYWYFLISPGLARIVRRLCFSLTPAGEPCELRGTRFPYVADVERSLQQASQIVRERLAGMPAYRRYSDLEEVVSMTPSGTSQVYEWPAAEALPGAA